MKQFEIAILQHIIQRLRAVYGIATPQEKEENDWRFNEGWSANQPIKEMWDRLEAVGRGDLRNLVSDILREFKIETARIKGIEDSGKGKDQPPFDSHSARSAGYCESRHPDIRRPSGNG